MCQGLARAVGSVGTLATRGIKTAHPTPAHFGQFCSRPCPAPHTCTQAAWVGVRDRWRHMHAKHECSRPLVSAMQRVGRGGGGGVGTDPPGGHMMLGEPTHPGLG